MNEYVHTLLDAFAPHFEARHQNDSQFALMPQPSQDFVIFMTPRSGSTWLSQLLIHHGGFGEPEEWFNPDNIAIDVAQTKAASLDRHLRQIRALKMDQRTGVFGVEISYYHLELIERLTSFFDVFDPRRTRFFYLTRRDTVAQSVSLYMATKTNIWNSLQGDTDDVDVPYNETEVAGWLQHLLQQEAGFERMFDVMKLRPVLLVYEDIIKAGTEKACRFFCEQLGVEFRGVPPETIRKIATEKNEEFATRLATSMNLQWLRSRCVEGAL
jgi:LPS sulfotransferase NodH